MKLHALRLLVTKFEECFTFYEQVMDLECTWGEAQGNFASFTSGEGSSELSLFRRDLMAQALGTSDLPSDVLAQDKSVLVFEVEDVDTFFQKQKNNLTVVKEPQDMADWGIRTAHVRDPEGNVVEIFTPLEKDQWSERLLQDDKKLAHTS